MVGLVHLDLRRVQRDVATVPNSEYFSLLSKKKGSIESFDEVLEVLEDHLQLVISCQDQSGLRAEGALKMHDVPRQFLVDLFQVRIARLQEERKRHRFLPSNIPPHPRIESRLSHMLRITNTYLGTRKSAATGQHRRGSDALHVTTVLARL